MPTVQGTDDFNHNIDASYYVDGFFGAPTAVTSPLYHTQPKSLSIVSTGANVGARHNLTGTPSRGWHAFPWRTTSHPPADVTIANMTSTGGQRGALHHGATGIFLNMSGSLGAVTAISLNTWYWVEMIYDATTGTHDIYARVSGTDLATPTGVAGTGTVEYSQFLSFAGDDSGITDFYGYWEWGTAASNSDWLGEPAGTQPSDDPPIGFLGRGAGW